MGGTGGSAVMTEQRLDVVGLERTRGRRPGRRGVAIAPPGRRVPRAVAAHRWNNGSLPGAAPPTNGHGRRTTHRVRPKVGPTGCPPVDATGREPLR
jgi:hypothetical protein